MSFFGKGKSSNPSERANEQLRVKERHRKAIEAVLGGKSYREAGKASGVSASRVCRIVARSLEQTVRETAASVDLLRAMEAARLDKLQWALWPSALKGNPRAVEALLRLMERRSKMLGLDRPAKMEVGLDVRDDEAALEAAIREIERPVGSSSSGADEGGEEGGEPPPEAAGDEPGRVD